MKPVIVIADDLTGAADTGVCFTRAGLSTAVTFSMSGSPAGDVLVFTTETRATGESEARRRTRDLMLRIPDSALIYKKIDSTLRGSPGPELAEMVSSLGIEKVLVAPAFPAQGRTTSGGVQLVDGLPIQRTSFQNEVAHSDLAQVFRDCGLPLRLIPVEMLRSGPEELEKILRAPGRLLLIGDAEADQDLQVLAIAAMHSGIRLFCGSAGLASALAFSGLLPPPTLVQASPLSPAPSGPVLVIAGSRNPVTAAQVNAARAAGLGVVNLDPKIEPGQSEARDEAVLVAGALLAQGQDVILTTSNSKLSALKPPAVAELLAQCARELACTSVVGALVITGGEVAMAVLLGLGASGIRLWGEFLPGLPFGSLLGGVRPDLPILTKAGGFGGEDALLGAMRFLKSRSVP